MKTYELVTVMVFFAIVGMFAVLRCTDCSKPAKQQESTAPSVKDQV